MPLKYKKNSKDMIAKKFDSISNINNPNIEYTTDITIEAKKARYKMNSITYSIYIFGVVLALCLIVLLYS
ncbi:hypothetical protein [Sedimentibacter sp. MB31-C6]|uniref:hypothetical protein n=1 Tax=Sedimentibacter sp. MB31-C6 TaxID=3109366 RepID=UPI002DDD1B20|nr:hypothetical protein [Sedimentibacter sp. MB36-C1]WSI04600.1 hypothetical protein U8307_02105 [Sedimentibacter sp. MB36-C1]